MKTKLIFLLFFAIFSIFPLCSEIVWNTTTIHADSEEVLFDIYRHKAAEHPDHFSIVTAQSTKAIAYEAIVRAVYQKLYPDAFTKKQLENRLFLRHPEHVTFHDKKNLWKSFPFRNSFRYEQTKKLGKFFFSTSPSLLESKSAESATYFFRINTNIDNIYEKLALQLLVQDGLDASNPHIQSEINLLFNLIPKSTRGTLVQFLIPKSKNINKICYLSKPLGIPTDHPDAEQALRTYKYNPGTNKQLRLLSSVFQKEGAIDSGEIKVIRYTLIPEEKLSAFYQKVEESIERIFQNHKATPKKKNSFYSEDVKDLIKSNLYEQALDLILLEKDQRGSHNLLFLTYFKFLTDGDTLKAYNWLEENEHNLSDSNRILLTYFALTRAATKDMHPLSLDLLRRLPPSSFKNYVLIQLSEKYNVEAYLGQISPEYSMDAHSREYSRLELFIQSDVISIPHQYVPGWAKEVFDDINQRILHNED